MKGVICSLFLENTPIYPQTYLEIRRSFRRQTKHLSQSLHAASTRRARTPGFLHPHSLSSFSRSSDDRSLLRSEDNYRLAATKTPEKSSILSLKSYFSLKTIHFHPLLPLSAHFSTHE